MRSRRWLANSKARFAAVQALYQWDHSQQTSIEMVQQEFEEHRFNTHYYQPIHKELFHTMLNKWKRERTQIDSTISCHLSEKWTLKRMAAPLRALLRLFVTEAVYGCSPPAVLWREYQELAQTFVDDAEIPFIHRFMSYFVPHNHTQESMETNNDTSSTSCVS